MVPARSRPRCGYDSGGAWESLSSAGGKWGEGAAFWVLWPEGWRGTGQPGQRELPRGWAVGKKQATHPGEALW